MMHYRYWSLTLVLIVTLVLAACGGGSPAGTTTEPTSADTSSGEADEPGDIADVMTDTADMEERKLSGTQVTVFGAFAQDEAARFEAAMVPFEEATGIDVVYEGGSDFETLITTRVEGGNPPDMAGFPQPGLMARFADDVVDITEIIPLENLQDRYAQSWIDMALTDDGKVLGVWHRVTVKSLVWYPPQPFQEAGYTTPQTWDELLTLSDQMVSDGYTPWYAPMESQAATGWVGTDWVEDIMLRTTSLEHYDQWVRGELPFTSPEVRNAFELMGQIMLNEEYMYGGKNAILTTSFFDSAKPLLDDPPSAWLVRQGNAMPGWIDPVPEVGSDGQLHYFYFPAIDEEYGRPVLVAGDVYAVFNDRPEVRALVEYLTTAQSLQAWIEEGGILSPHKDINMEWYSVTDRGVAEILARADAVRFDGSDLMPAAVGTGTFWNGVVDYINGEDLDTVLQTIDESWPAE